MGDNTLPDQVSGMKELASDITWIDIERATIYAHSGGGYATATRCSATPTSSRWDLRAATTTIRAYEDDWAEKWQGLLKDQFRRHHKLRQPGQPASAKNLKGKLLLAHGTMDSNVPPVNTMLVVMSSSRRTKISTCSCCPTGVTASAMSPICPPPLDLLRP